MRGMTAKNCTDPISNLVIVEADDGRPLLVDGSAVDVSAAVALAFTDDAGMGYHLVEHGERFFWVWSKGEDSTAADDEVRGPFPSLVEAVESAVNDWEENGDGSIRLSRMMKSSLTALRRKEAGTVSRSTRK